LLLIFIPFAAPVYVGSYGLSNAELSALPFIGAIVFGLIVNGGTIPGRHATDLLTALDAIPGALLGMAAVYYEGVRRERQRRTGVAGLPRR